VSFRITKIAKTAPRAVNGYLKQLLFILTTTRDGAVPIQFRCEAGNQSDVSTHVATWESLCRVAGTSSFLYVADSKLCSRQAMEHIDRKKGRFVTVLPRSRREDALFREWIQDHEPKWELAIDRQNPRKKWGPRDRWYVYRSHLPSSEGWPVIWVFSPLLRLQQQASRHERIAKAEQKLDALASHHSGPRPRRKDHHEIRTSIDKILDGLSVKPYFKVSVDRIFKHTYRQDRPGRPGPDTRFIRTTKTRWKIEWKIDEEKIAYDHRSDGMYPVITNDRKLAAESVLKAHKRQPQIERRFETLKTVHEIAPVLLKNEGRIEALFFLYFTGLLVQALIERALRLAMDKENIDELPIYPEERPSAKPTAEQIFRLFSHLQKSTLVQDGRVLKAFAPELTDIQKQVLKLLGVPAAVYSSAR
jgi:transposase